jgi:hypothetical protein
LLRNDPHLRDLNRWYRAYATEHGIETLVLQEAHRIGFLGQVVKLDSSDPGLPNAILIPIEADHVAISKPADRSSEVCLHLRDFLAHPNLAAPARVQIASALSHLEATVAGNERVFGEIKEALSERDSHTRSVSASLADAEATKRISVLRRSRFFVGFDAPGQARRLADEVTTGELASASAAAKVEILAWCARFLARHPWTEDAERILGGLSMARDTDEIRVAKAIVTAARGSHAAALNALSGMTSGLALTASLSGTTLIAAETTGRECFAMELDPLFVDVAVKRWQAFTGKDATLAGGSTFEAEMHKRLASDSNDAVSVPASPPGPKANANSRARPNHSANAAEASS